MIEDLLNQDRDHLLHPLHHPNSHANPLIVESGERIYLHTVDGRTLMDGLSALWNVLVGYGRSELTAAAQQQMSQLAYCSNYAGLANLPVIELAERLAGYAYPNLNYTYFTSGGAEANESAFKTARYYWKRLGQPDKVKIIARQDAYHGVTLAAMSATGIAPYWPMFEPRVPGFLHIVAPYPYRFAGDVHDGETIGEAAARALEDAILREGPETVAAFIAEPVQGAGGVIVPPDDYFPRIRQICDQYEVLLIADEVITGFGRTGELFALNRYGLQPDILSFAKGITSGYLPLGGIQLSDAIKEVILTAPPVQTWMHAYTYSGHATCCAVALANLNIIERENLPERARAMGARLLAGLLALTEEFDCIGNVRGLGLMCAVEFVADRETKAAGNLAGPVLKACLERGLLTRAKGESLLLAPPLIISEEEVDEMLGLVREAIGDVIRKP
ncbi:MAG: aspartate aminotransferase family protein [Chloroflexota bacterium]|nr:aspartate aminotransferase family protein [Ardenticatenaceae bacterium]GIK57972.1 MAG: aspartate aminotransferase family protein [Chloroflexota bacterium]